MLRKKIFSLKNHYFRERGTDILRIEALSDGVFAFSVSLLVVSLEVPQTFGELKTILLGAVPFFATVAMLFLFWYQQYRFFRCYGLNDLPVTLLNLAYLAVILFYVYPLKFLFTLLLAAWTGMNLFPVAAEKGLVVLDPSDLPALIILFSVGYTVIWLLLWLMHLLARKHGGRLELTPYERLYTRKELLGAALNSGVGLFAIAFALLGWTNMAGYCYLLIPFLLAWNNRRFRQASRRLPDKTGP